MAEFGLQEGALGRLFLFTCEGTREQHIVFQADVFHQVVDHLVNAVIHGFPGGAGFWRRRHVVGDVFDHFHQFTRIVMFAFHHADWPHRLATHALFDHREQDLLFFHHVAGQLFMQHGQVFRQTARYVRFVCVNAFNFSGLQDQLRQLFAVSAVSLQPAEFAKFATALALAKYMSAYSFTIKSWKNALMLAFLILLPMMLIILQRETGSALVYTAFFLMLYREGMPGVVLFSGICAVVYFVVGIRFDQVFIADTPTPIGEFAVLSMVLLFAGGMVWVYKKKWEPVRNIIGGSFVVLLIAYLVSEYMTPFNLVWVQWGLCVVVTCYLFFLALSERHWSYFLIGLFAIGSIGFLYSSDYFFNKVLEPHQQIRIKVVLGMEEDLAGAGYNVNQSKIAIGSGGLTGKGFLNGTQTKLKYVPEQDTDFIFCTVGEEEGFIGSTIVLLLFLTLILRLIALAERQQSAFGRVYGYSVLSIFLFHLFINIGMVLGLTPVIGIPLPFFSYGGSSLWGFTILLFIFLRIDAGRNRRLV